MYSKNYKTFFFGITVSANISGLYMGYQIALVTALANEFSWLHDKSLEFTLYTNWFTLGLVIGICLCRLLINWKGRYFWLVLQNILGSIGSLMGYFMYQSYIFGGSRLIWGLSSGFIPLSSLFYIKEIIPSAYSSRYLSSFHLFLLWGNITPF